MNLAHPVQLKHRISKCDGDDGYGYDDDNDGDDNKNIIMIIKNNNKKEKGNSKWQ